MITYIVDGKKVDPNGNEVGTELAADPAPKDEGNPQEVWEDTEQVAEPIEPSPFASLSEAVQKSLADAGITTLEQAKALKKEGLVALEGIGDVTADKILAL